MKARAVRLCKDDATRHDPTGLKKEADALLPRPAIRPRQAGRIGRRPHQPPGAAVSAAGVPLSSISP
jgi:hypothetical protein